MLFHSSQTPNRRQGWRTPPQTSTSSSLDQTPPGPAPPNPAASNAVDNVSHAFSTCVGVAINTEFRRTAESQLSGAQLFDSHQTTSISKMSMTEDIPQSLSLDLRPTQTHQQSSHQRDAEMRKSLSSLSINH